MLREVASLVLAGLSPDDAASLAEIEPCDVPLTTNTFYLPTPVQLVDLCREIQAGWSPAERRRRQVIQDVEPWEAPVVSTRGLVA